MVKTEQEIKDIRKAVEITDAIYSEIREYIEEGQTEKQILNFILSKIEESEAEGPSFDPIVAAAAGAAEPHHEASDYKVKDGDMIVIDFGVKVNGLCSDMTRMVAIGEPNEEIIEAYNIVREALEESTREVIAGRQAKNIDAIARDLIDWEGYGENFIHTTGHGLGTEVHEAPMIYFKSKERLQENEVITIEPGIYVEGKFGIRLENDILVKKDGYEILNKSSLDY